MTMAQNTLSSTRSYSGLWDEPEKLTLENVNVLIDTGQHLHRNLEIVKQDIDLFRDKRVIYAIDFSELHSYLWPERARGNTSYTTNALLASPGVSVTLLPGTTAELIRHIRNHLQANENAREQVERLMENPFAAAILTKFQNEENMETFDTPMEELPHIQSILDAVGRMHSFSSRLSALAELKGFIPFGDCVAMSKEPIRPDIDCMRDSLSSLTFRRPGDSKNNRIDAHNHALIWALNDAQFHDHDTVYLLVTSSHAPYSVFNRMKWETKRTPPISLVRHPIQVLYYQDLLNYGEDAFEKISEVCYSLGNMLHAWRKMPRYSAYQTQQGESQYLLKPTTPIPLPRSRNYLGHTITFRAGFERLFGNTKEVLISDLVGQENMIRVQKNVYNQGSMSYLTELAQPATTRASLRLFDTVNRLALEAIDKLKKDLQGLDHLIDEVDIDGVIRKRPPLKINSKHNTDFGCTEFVVSLPHDKGDLIIADIYENYYVIWWTTKVTFDEFLLAVRRFLRDSVKNESEQNERTHGLKKKFNGIYLYPTENREPAYIPLENMGELNPEDLLEYADLDSLNMARIATDIGDLCYDLGSSQSSAQRVGVVSHRKLTQELSGLIHYTTLKPVSFSDTQEIVQALFQKYDEEGRRHDVSHIT
jgi:hypothetical protein